jgi:hypothetical protein
VPLRSRSQSHTGCDLGRVLRLLSTLDTFRDNKVETENDLDLDLVS